MSPRCGRAMVHQGCWLKCRVSGLPLCKWIRISGIHIFNKPSSGLFACQHLRSSELGPGPGKVRMAGRSRWKAWLPIWPHLTSPLQALSRTEQPASSGKTGSSMRASLEPEFHFYRNSISDLYAAFSPQMLSQAPFSNWEWIIYSPIVLNPK